MANVMRWEDRNKETGKYKKSSASGFSFPSCDLEFISWVLNQIWNSSWFPDIRKDLVTCLWNAGCGATFVFSPQHISLKRRHTLKCTDLATGTTFIWFRAQVLSGFWLYLIKHSLSQLTKTYTYHLSRVKSIEVLQMVLSHYHRKIETISSQFSHRQADRRRAGQTADVARGQA